MKWERIVLDGLSCTLEVHRCNIRRFDSSEVTGIFRGRGRPNKTWIETVRDDLMALNLTDDIALWLQDKSSTKETSKPKKDKSSITAPCRQKQQVNHLTGSSSTQVVAVTQLHRSAPDLTDSQSTCPVLLCYPWPIHLRTEEATQSTQIRWTTFPRTKIAATKATMDWTKRIP